MMISADFPTHRFQLRAAAIVADDGFVLLHRPEGATVWALPGGRVAPGEAAQQAILRELAEELGAAVECGSLLYVIENFFTAENKAYHEIGLYFRATLAPGTHSWTNHARMPASKATRLSSSDGSTCRH